MSTASPKSFNTVYRYRVLWDSPWAGTLEIPEHTRPVLAGRGQDGELSWWLEVDRDSLPTHKFTVFRVGTGLPLPEGSFHFHSEVDRSFVWHYYLQPAQAQ